MAIITLYRDPNTYHYVYHIEEPPVSQLVSNLYKQVREKLQSMEIELPEDPQQKIHTYISYIMYALRELGFDDAFHKYPELIYYLIRDTIGWRIIDVLIHDPRVEDISYSSLPRKLFVVMRHDRIPVTWIETNILLSEEELSKLIEFMAFKTGKTISVANPLLEARTPEGYRLAANLKEVSISSGFTIRKFPEDPISITKLIYNKTMSPLLASYLWTLVEYQKFIIIMGAMATGKTTVLQSILSAIPRDKKVVTIEDTPELRLDHPLWQPYYTRGSMYGTEQNITMIDLGRFALRSRAQYIVIGEVRDREIETLVQMAATGHGSLCTFHAENPETLFLRLTSPPLNVQPSFMLTIASIVLQVRVWSRKYKKFVRRTSKVWEVTGIKHVTREIEIPVEYKPVFIWDPYEDKHYPETVDDLLEESKQLNIIGTTVYGEDDWYEMMKWELEEKTRFLEQLVREGVFDFREVTEKIYRKSEEMRMKT
ncbi:MAG: type II/IV secretion system ATPase subunit [Ignisphaera sp.]|uniref:Bacterial type II secretion system protein E domain-containing protein n=1 Tax=Ignisphaera aggregans TaxID=334771 RepID=A0A7C4H4X4_9CREN